MPVFIRPAGMKPMCEPVSGGSIELLKDVVNVKTRGDFVMLVSSLLAGLWPAGPYLVLVIFGPPGSGKSRLCILYRRIVDPSVAPIRAAAQSEEAGHISRGVPPQSRGDGRVGRGR